jgi:hypothetical protein
MKPPKAISDYMAELGRKGGSASGPRKRRSAEHYERLAAMRRKPKPINGDSNA